MAVAKNCIPFLDDHWSRLISGAKLLSLELPSSFSKEYLQKSVCELLSLNAINGCAYVRVTIYREGKGRYSPCAMQAGFAIETEPLQGELFALNDKGLSVGIFSDMLKPVDRLSGFKTCSALIYVLASIHKANSGWDDCLILNTCSNICDSTNSNVFLVKDNLLVTPALSEGCVSGVMRKQVMTIAKKNGFAVDEAAIAPQMLRQADELFLTNAVRGIRWVHRCENTEYGNNLSLALAEKLKKLVS